MTILGTGDLGRRRGRAVNLRAADQEDRTVGEAGQPVLLQDGEAVELGGGQEQRSRQIQRVLRPGPRPVAAQ